MTSKDHYALSVKTRASSGDHHENLNEDRLNCQRRRCSAMTLDSGNIRFMRILAVVLKIYVNFPLIYVCLCHACAYIGRVSAVTFFFFFFRLSAKSRSLTTISTVLFSTLICPQPPSSEKRSPSHPPNRWATVFFSFLLLIFPSFFLQKFLVEIRRV